MNSIEVGTEKDTSELGADGHSTKGSKLAG
jgi:hypothetical protein